MHLRQFIQSVLGLVFLVTSSFALSNTEFTYNVIDGGIEITGCVDGCSSDLIIPEVIDGYTIKKIGREAFNSKLISSIVIPDDVTYIGEGAFKHNLLTGIEIPEGVTFVGGEAFYDNKLTEIVLPPNITSIEKALLAGNQLTQVNIPAGVTYIGEGAFKHNLLTGIEIPEGVTFVGGEAFYDNKLITITYCSDSTGLLDELSHIAALQLGENCDNTNNQFESNQYSAIDLDQNGSFDALTDGLILLRYAFALRGDNLINGAIAPDAARTSVAEIEAHIQSLLP